MEADKWCALKARRLFKNVGIYDAFKSGYEAIYSKKTGEICFLECAKRKLITFSCGIELKEPDIIALGAQNLVGTSWNWTRMTFRPEFVGWNSNLPTINDSATCLGYEMGRPLKASIFPCMEPKRIMCN
jgi:hypothetical protein